VYYNELELSSLLLPWGSTSNSWKSEMIPTEKGFNGVSKLAGSENASTSTMPRIIREVSLFIFQDIIYLWVMKASIMRVSDSWSSSNNLE
jgi:hypothetical protein